MTTSHFAFCNEAGPGVTISQSNRFESLTNPPHMKFQRVPTKLIVLATLLILGTSITLLDAQEVGENNLIKNGTFNAKADWGKMTRVKLCMMVAALALMLSVSNQAKAQVGGTWSPPFRLPGGMIGVPYVTSGNVPVLCVDEDADGEIDS